MGLSDHHSYYPSPPQARGPTQQWPELPGREDLPTDPDPFSPASEAPSPAPKTGLLSLLLKEYSVLPIVIFWVFWAGGGLDRGGNNSRMFSEQGIRKSTDIWPRDFAGSKDITVKPLTLIAFTSAPISSVNKTPPRLMENKTSACCLFTTLCKSSHSHHSYPSPHLETFY